MKLTVRFLVISAIVAIGVSAHAQWLTPDNSKITTNCVSYPTLPCLVGVNAPAPYAPLQVVGPSSSPSIMHNTAAVLAVTGSNNVDLAMGTDTVGPYGAWLQARHNTIDAAYPLIFQPAGGNVGIGTSSPTHKLEVRNTLDGLHNVIVSTPMAANFITNAPIGGLRLSWKYGSTASNDVDLQVVRGLNAIDGAGFAVSTAPNNATAPIERMRVTSAGRVGIGESAPTARLMVHNNETNVQAFLAQQYSVYSANANSSDMAANGLMKTSVQAGVTQSGTALGQSGLSYLEGAGTLQTAFGLLGYVKVTPGHTGTINNAYGVWADVDKFNGVVGNGYGLYVGDIEATNDYGIFQSGQNDSNQFNGDVTIGATGATGTRLTVNGNVAVSGSITGASVIGATYQDLAEWVPASSDMEPGTVVVLNHDRTNEVMPSNRAYDTSVAGVVSAQPGIILGVGSTSKEQIATTGRVKVRVDATKAPIKIGDLLVSSDVPGAAMRSDPMILQGRVFHQPGTIIGKALESLESGEGEILVLLSLQ